jgi:GalNAc5-diNAcBac-PP-undecaprenol beta-1,3-glucosyltransferase
MTPRATVLIPTHDHGATLLHSTRSALAQTVREIEVFVVGDGMSPDTTLAADELERADTRVRVFRFPKGPRHGEIHRHAALAEASGAIVCYLSDDDLWLPNHVEVMEELLRAADFAHTLGIRVQPDGRLRVGNKVDFGLPGIRDLVFTPGLRVGGTSLSAMAHTMAMYRRLPAGWDTTPAGTPTEVAMSRKFIQQSECRLASGTTPTLIRFPSPGRRGWPPEQRLAELSAWSRQIESEEWGARLPSLAFEAVVRADAEKFVQLKVLKHAHLRKRRAFRQKLQAERERVKKLRALLKREQQ